MKKNVIESLIIIFFLLILELSGCLKESQKNEKIDSISIAIDQDIIGFYPWVKSYELYTLLLNRNIYNSLVNFDEIFRVIPSLAISWNNPDNSTWRFNLRKNVTFHNGYKFSSEDVKYSIDLIRENESESNQFRSLLKLIDEVKIIDNYTIEIKTIKPCPNLLNLLTDIFIVSKQYQEEAKTQQPIGTGAYKLINHTKNNYISLQRYDDYWKKDLPEIKYVAFKVIRNYENSTKALIDHEVDIAQINQKYLDNNFSYDFSVKKTDNPTIAYISFDFREKNNIVGYNENNPLADSRVRKAIYQAINIDEMLNNSQINSNSSQFVTSLVFGYNPNITRLSYNVENATQLMKEAEYENGFNVTFDYSYDVFLKKTIDFIKKRTI